MQKYSLAYTVHQLARMAGVSVRALHYFDQIGLLKPSSRSRAGYRQYLHADLLLLQQILFYKELGVPLTQIRSILTDHNYDPALALQTHRGMLAKRKERIERLLVTIDKTIQSMTEGNMELGDEELYEGFSKEQRERYQREALEMYDPDIVRGSEQRIRRMSKAQWQAVKDEGHAITQGLAALKDSDPASPEVQVLIARHHAWIEHFYTAPAELYRALGEGYASHPEFRAFYERYTPDLADFLKVAMAYYADHSLS